MTSERHEAVARLARDQWRIALRLTLAMMVVYFGFGYLAQLALMRRASRMQALPASVIAWMSWIAMAMLVLGVANVVAGLAVADPLAKDRWENVFEWWLGLLMVGWYGVLALGWRRQGLALELKRHDPL